MMNRSTTTWLLPTLIISVPNSLFRAQRPGQRSTKICSARILMTQRAPYPRTSTMPLLTSIPMPVVLIKRFSLILKGNDTSTLTRRLRKRRSSLLRKTGSRRLLRPPNSAWNTTKWIKFRNLLVIRARKLWLQTLARHHTGITIKS